MNQDCTISSKTCSFSTRPHMSIQTVKSPSVCLVGMLFPITRWRLGCTIETNLFKVPFDAAHCRKFNMGIQHMVLRLINTERPFYRHAANRRMLSIKLWHGAGQQKWEQEIKRYRDVDSFKDMILATKFSCFICASGSANVELTGIGYEVAKYNAMGCTAWDGWTNNN